MPWNRALSSALRARSVRTTRYSRSVSARALSAGVSVMIRTIGVEDGASGGYDNAGILRPGHDGQMFGMSRVLEPWPRWASRPIGRVILIAGGTLGCIIGFLMLAFAFAAMQWLEQFSSEPVRLGR